MMEKLAEYDFRVYLQDQVTATRSRIESITIDNVLETGLQAKKKLWRLCRNIEYFLQCKSIEEARHMLRISDEIKTVGDLF